MKRMAPFLIALAMMCTSASAASEIRIKEEKNDIIEVSGNAEIGERISVIVLNPDFEYADYIGDDREKRNEAVQHIGYAVGNSEGFTFSFSVEKSNGGVFSIYVNGKRFEYEYYGKSAKEEVIIRYNNGLADADELVRVMGFENNDVFVSLGIESSVLAVSEIMTLPQDPETAYNDIFDVLLLAAYNKHCQSSLFDEGIIQFAKELEIDETEEYEDYLSSLSEEGKKAVEKSLMSGIYKTKEDIRTKFFDSVYTNLILNYTKQGYGHMNTFFNKYKDKYERAGIENPLENDKNAYRNIIGISATSLAELKAEMNKTTETSAGSSGGLSSSGKFSSGGSAGGSITPVPTAKPQTHVTLNDISEGHWAYDSVIGLAEQGVISGDENGAFQPDRNITRAEFTKMLCVLLNISGGSSAFSDVSKDDWFEKYVSAAASRDIISGYDGRFEPNSRITRQDAAVIVARAGSLWEDGECGFEDDGEISDYAKGAVKALYKQGIINGMTKSTFAPKEYLTRAQAAVILASIRK